MPASLSSCNGEPDPGAILVYQFNVTLGLSFHRVALGRKCLLNLHTQPATCLSAV